MLAAAALLLPAIIVLAQWFSNYQSQQRQAVERDALEAARQIVDLADAETMANRRILRLMAGAPSMRDKAELEGVLIRQVRNNRGWMALLVRDARTGEVLAEHADRIDPAALRPLPARLPGRSAVEGVFATGRYCPCVIMHAAIAEPAGRVLTLYVSPDRYQDIVERHGKNTVLAGLFDGEGRFVGRSLNFEERVGTPGTAYVRRAIAIGGEGFYRGVTFEGLRNYTAYVKNAETGWSGHVAVDRDLIDGARSSSNAGTAIAVLAALVLAAGLMFYAANETRARRREEEKLVAMQKAEAISRFTGTTVHDFRNILAVVDAGVRLIERHTAEPQTAERAKGIHDAVERGKRLVNQLLSFVKGDGAEVRMLDLKACIEGFETMLTRSLGDGIEFSWSVAEDARFARANADQLELALLNLAINARDAMDGRGKFNIDANREGEMVAIAACDSGPGVPANLRSRIFEAFYSTKGDGKGTGLGLAQVAGAARQAEGRVELREAPGGGACFVIYLPAEADPGA